MTEFCPIALTGGGMKLCSSVDINGPPEPVFDAFSQDTLGVLYPEIVERQLSGEFQDKPGTHTILRIPHGGKLMEMSETLIEVERPNRIASVVHVLRFLPLPPETRRDGEIGVVGDELDAAFRLEFGQKPVKGLVLVEFVGLPTGKTRITQTIDMQMGGIGGLVNRLLRRTRFSPISKQLRAFKTAFEAAQAGQQQDSAAH